MKQKTIPMRRFDWEILLQILTAEMSEIPISREHVWITNRGNSWCSIHEVLIPQRLVCMDKKGNYFTTNKGKEAGNVFLLRQSLFVQTEIAKIEREIQVLEKQKSRLPIGCQRRQLIILDVDYLCKDREKILFDTINV